jgi:hypothetical protein
MNFLHYTTNPISKLKSTSFTSSQFIGKPIGLWLSVGDDWLKWCENNGFYTFNKNNYHVYDFFIQDTSKLCVIYSRDALFDFVKKYECEFVDTATGIDWKRVYTDYDGIAFYNYFNIKLSLPLKDIYRMTWFYGIDVSSVCVWNTDILRYSLRNSFPADISDF